MTADEGRRATRRLDEPRVRHYTVTSRASYPEIPPRYRVLGLAGLAVVLLLLLGGTLLVQADTSPDERPRLLRSLTDAVWSPERNSQVATPAAPAIVPAAATSLPSEPRYAVALSPLQPSPTVSRATPTSPPLEGRAASAAATRAAPASTSPPLVGRAESGTVAWGPLPPTALSPVPTGTSGAASAATRAAIALPPPHTATLAPAAFAAVPAFGVPAVPATKTLVSPTAVLPTPTQPPPPTTVPTPLPSPTAPPSLTATPVASPSPPPTPTVAPSATALPISYKLGDPVAITQVLKGFAFTGHWPNSPEGIYATDWYPRSATQPCANSHRMPLAMPVAGKWRVTSVMSPLGGTQYTLIGELDDGNSVAFTHVDPDVLTGRVAANTVVGFVGISGLEQFDAMGENPSHAHTAWNDHVVPNWDGDAGNRPARDFFPQYGFQVEIRDPAYGATPQTYMMRQACGGMVGVPRPAGRG
ncbi:MAG TPA: hypothetical protein VK066_06315 [Chloroflexota bacterium]|nr:hypothetical protein [Chloroflexota bacterium]